MLSLGQEHPLEEEVATHSSTLTWRIPQAEEGWSSTVHSVAEGSSVHGISRQEYWSGLPALVQGIF